MTAVAMPPANAAARPDPRDLNRLRREVREVLASPAAAPGWRALAEPGDDGEGDPRPLYRLLGAHRLLAPAWPAAFGGRGAPAEAGAVVVEEMVTAGIPDTPLTLSVQICGNFLLRAGQPAQRARLLPRLAAGTSLCAVLYSEQEAGSDLASLATRADASPGGGWSITGRKLYSVRATLADTALVAARTSAAAGADASRYQDLTLFLIALTAPGVTVRRLASLADEAFADIRLDGVPAGPGDVVGPVGGAWPLITEALALERTGADHVARARAWLTLAAAAAPASRSEDERWTREAGRLGTRTAAAAALSRRCLAGLDRGQVPAALAAATKLWCSETARAVAVWSLEALGEAALWSAGDPDAAAGGRLEAARREAPGLVISAGTSEMMREVIAAVGLSVGELMAGLGEPGADPVRQDLGLALAAAARLPGDRAWTELAGAGMLRLGLPAACGGLGLGRAAQVTACRALGERGYDGTALDTMTVLDAVAAAAGPAAARRALPALADGRRRGVLLDPARPARPVTDPGPGGLVLVLPAAALLAAADGEPGDLRVLDADAAAVVTREHRTPAGPMRTAGLAAGGAGEVLAAPAGTAAAVLAADLLRRAAWLIGAGDASLAVTLERVRRRRQFGRALIENQAIAHRLADLAAHRAALSTLLEEEVHATGAEAGAATGADAGAATGDSLARPAGLLAEAGRFATAAAAEAVHLHGAAGMVRGAPPERFFWAVPLAIARSPAADLLDRRCGRLIRAGTAGG
jgi:alkylation response protein AidB-like acyl-CoA dehydrogenase